MKSRILTTAVAGLGAFSALGLLGCTPEARQDVKEAGSNVSQATEKSVEGTAEAVDKAGDKVAEEAKEAGAAVKEGVQETGQAVKEGASQVGEAVGGAVDNAAEATKGAATAVAKGADKVDDTLSLTPKIKNALVSSKQIDASTIDVDTDAGKKVVMIKGTIPTKEKKDLATQIAKKALTDSGSEYAGYKVQNDLTVSGG